MMAKEFTKRCLINESRLLKIASSEIKNRLNTDF